MISPKRGVIYSQEGSRFNPLHIAIRRTQRRLAPKLTDADWRRVHVGLIDYVDSADRGVWVLEAHWRKGVQYRLRSKTYMRVRKTVYYDPPHRTSLDDAAINNALTHARALAGHRYDVRWIFLLGYWGDADKFICSEVVKEYLIVLLKGFQAWRGKNIARYMPAHVHATLK